MSAALGRLPNAPLAYVLAQVRFEPFLEIEKHIPALQTSLRAHYPRFRRFERVGFEVLLTEAAPLPQVQPMPSSVHWEFGTAANFEGVMVQPHSLVFHVTAYETYEQFGQAWLWVMRQVGAHIPELFVNRIGLRYVDFIVPNPDETPEDYVVDRLRCDPALGRIPCQHHQGLTLAEYRLETGFLAVRYSRGMGRPTLPPDLSELSLQPSAIMQRVVADHQPTAVLDIDRFMALSAAYDAEALAEQFGKMHEETSAVFKALTTDHARAVWKNVALPA
jgi:uncharacterized protein (TIGR04255 family)